VHDETIIRLKEEANDENDCSNANDLNIPHKVDPFTNALTSNNESQDNYFSNNDVKLTNIEDGSKFGLINKMLQPKQINYQFAYKKNNIINELFKSEVNKELNVILQALSYFQEKGYLDD
jgi:hypothetical protein